MGDTAIIGGTSSLVREPVVDAFADLRAPRRADQARALGLYPYFKAMARHGGGTVVVDGEQYVLTGSNDYLGLTQDERVREAARAAVDDFGMSASGSRFLTGTLELHETLEAELADFLGKESALIFSAGFLGTASAVASLGGRRNIVYFDDQNHASMIDGSRMAANKPRRFQHNDAADLERLLKEDEGLSGGRVVYTEGIFSMSGHIGAIPEVVEVARRYGARVVCDDAHATGVLGPRGEGSHAHFDLTDEVDVVAGTFSKAMASVGGFLAGTTDVIDYIRHTSRPFIFSTALPAPNIAASLAALRIIRSEPEHREQMWSKVDFMRQNLLSLGFDLLGSNSPIVPVLVGDESTAFQFWRGLWEEKVFATPAIPPAVAAGRSLIRTSFNTAHKLEHLERVLAAFEKVGRSLRVIS
ncbi:aminotransferase class I/II-fold pyridoxal phosphate-dependent enzyme [Lentzea sp. NPDC058436]|uniref:aminotransferase class I/II-fold pyridoxal phosphate-dependent enzyme n=1 Tax=Lentzea sp. NPDC058436 TaxID=3346499 RepID=UPI00365E7CB7